MTKKIAMVFPGQGSQSLGMLSESARIYPVILRSFEEASDALGYDLWALTQTGPEAKLHQTQYTQPALLAAGVALWRVWQAQYPSCLPIIMAGHSLGEYTALVCAESLPFDQAVRLVAERGRLMQAAVAQMPTAMAAILGLSEESVQAACREAALGEIVAPANYNSPGQVVIAGEKMAVERAIQVAKTLGAKRAILLPVSVPSHCALMAPAALQLAPILRAVPFKTPKIPVLHNVDLCLHHEAETIQNALIDQLVQPVRWLETIQAMLALGSERFIECGPGKVLSGLIKRIAPETLSVSIQDDKEELCL